MNRKRRQMPKAAGILAGILLLTGCGGGGQERAESGWNNENKNLPVIHAVAQADYPREPVYKKEEERWEARMKKGISDSFQTAYGSFVCQTASQLLSENLEDNVIYSPVGLYYALSMAAYGACGETQKELLSLLGYTNKEKLAEDCQCAFQVLYHVPNPENRKPNEWGELPADALYQLQIASSLWADESLELTQEFADSAARYFYSDIYTMDLHGSGAADFIADWVKERTHEVIVPAEEPVPGEELLSLKNTVYYADEWMDRFDKDKTEQDVFTTADKAFVTCDFMNRKMSSHGFRRGENYTSSFLSLKNGSMIFVLPDEGVDVRQLAESPKVLQEVILGTSGQKTGEVIWKVPKFSYGSSMEVSEALKKLGAEACFGPAADFSGITSQKPLGISRVSQNAHIAIDENGVEAAAFTEIAYAGAALPDGRAEMILNRPFLYGIQVKGQLLFVGICGNPGISCKKK